MASRVFSKSIALSNAKTNLNLTELMARLMSSNASHNVGFIGLGNMGGHMARNLAKKVSMDDLKIIAYKYSVAGGQFFAFLFVYVYILMIEYGLIIKHHHYQCVNFVVVCSVLVMISKN